MAWPAGPTCSTGCSRAWGRSPSRTPPAPVSAVSWRSGARMRGSAASRSGSPAWTDVRCGPTAPGSSTAPLASGWPSSPPSPPWSPPGTGCCWPGSSPARRPWQRPAPWRWLLRRRFRRGKLPPLMSTETPSTWSPILSPEAADRALRGVEEIAADVRKSAEEQAAGSPAWLRRGPSLAGGDAGEAYFFTYLDQVRPGAGYDDVAMSLLERAIEATGNLQAPPGLYSGFSGVPWTVERPR